VHIENGYRSFSSADGERALHYLIENNISLLGIPGFYYNQGWKIKTFVRDGMFVPVREAGSKKIQGLQIRFDDGKTRYLWFSETNKSYGTPISRWCHFVGPEDAEIYFITERALKADVVFELTGIPVIGLAGTGAIETLPQVLQYLQKRQDKPITFLDAFDIDFITNPNVSRDRKRLHELLEGKYLCTVVMWPPEQKGLDDYMKYAKEIGGMKKCRTICSRLILETRRRKQEVGKDLFLGYLGIL